jgi:hypothetical protein
MVILIYLWSVCGLPFACGAVLSRLGWCPHVCQWRGAGVPQALAALRAQRTASGKPFHVTVYDNGVPTPIKLAKVHPNHIRNYTFVP